MDWKYLILYLFIFGIYTTKPSVLSGTLVKTSKGFVCVEHITKGDLLVGCTKENALVDVHVIDMVSEITHDIIEIETTDTTIQAATDQLFFDPQQQKWITAKFIIPEHYFLDSNFQYHKCISTKRIHTDDPILVYKLVTTYPHNFFVYEQEFLTHNFLPFIGLGITCLFGSGLEFSGITIVASIASLMYSINLFKKHTKSGGSFHIKSKNNNGIGPNKQPNNNNNSEDRKYNTVAKSTFFKKMKDQYQYWREDKYIRRHGAKGLGKKAEFLKWDHLHNDVEAFDTGGKHLGSYNPETLQLYKPAKPMYSINIR